jgi:Mg2+ and Co2+ transporter CorA
MKVLTLTSVILLPGALIAGLMGMNFQVGLFEVTWPFYMVIAFVAVIAVVTLTIANCATGSSRRSPCATPSLH